MIERGAVVDDFEDDEDGQSEDDSNVSGGIPTPDDKNGKTGKPALKPTATPGNQGLFNAG